jgi:hypothetical protein
MSMPGFSTVDTASSDRASGVIIPAAPPPCPIDGTFNECLADCRTTCHEFGSKDYVSCVSGCPGKCASCLGRRPADSPGPSPGGGPGPGSGGLPIHGNYCGPGYGDPSGMTPPIDAVDAVCRVHDLCYGARGYFNCGCDRALISAMPTAIGRSPTPAAKAAGAAIMAYFSGWPCQCPLILCFPLLGCAFIPLLGGVGVGGLGPC